MVKAPEEIDRIIKLYISKLKEMDIHIECVMLYGSYATGQAREESDIDLIVISNDFEDMDIRERLEALGMAAARIMQPVQARGYTPDEIESSDKSSFLAEALERSKIAA